MMRKRGKIAPLRKLDVFDRRPHFLFRARRFLTNKFYALQQKKNRENKNDNERNGQQRILHYNWKTMCIIVAIIDVICPPKHDHKHTTNIV